MELWLWSLNHLQEARDAEGAKLYHKSRQGVTFALADTLCWLLAARCQILDVLELEAKGPANPALAEGLAGTVGFLTDLCHVQSARAAGEVGRVCAELFTATTAGRSPTGEFARLRSRIDSSLSGCRLAKIAPPKLWQR